MSGLNKDLLCAATLFTSTSTRVRVECYVLPVQYTQSTHVKSGKLARYREITLHTTQKQQQTKKRDVILYYRLYHQAIKQRCSAKQTRS